jgi:hypothetical protein
MLTDAIDRYNRYLAVAAQVVRRSLNEEKRLIAERRGVMEMRFAKWEVNNIRSRVPIAMSTLEQLRRTSD